MEWVREGWNYWENPECPRDYLEKSLQNLIQEIEGVRVPEERIQKYTEQELRKLVSRYEYFSDK